jgi:hypothetical protein
VATKELEMVYDNFFLEFSQMNLYTPVVLRGFKGVSLLLLFCSGVFTLAKKNDLFCKGIDEKTFL